MKFDPTKYETVKQRKIRFYTDYPDGRIIVHQQSEHPLEYALFEALIYLSSVDQMADLPRSKGYALEIRDTELSTSSKGGTYESVNYSSWVENCEESAVGRALDNAGYASNMRCSKEEMQKAGNRTHPKFKSGEEWQTWLAGLPEEVKQFCKTMQLTNKEIHNLGLSNDFDYEKVKEAVNSYGVENGGE
jgi:hypothetical protein